MLRFLLILMFVSSLLGSGRAAAQTPPKTVPEPPAAATPKPTPAPPFQRMHWRAIGPAASGGRIAGVAGSASDPNLYYVGTAGGGVWKTMNGGQTWNAVFESARVSAIGALAIDPNNNQVAYAGTGESNPRNDVSYGDGVYKTVDGGKTWTNTGLAGTRHIARILIDPRDSNHVIAGALGDVFRDSADRGVYVSNDAGKTWNKTLYVSDSSGASDLAMDVQHRMSSTPACGNFAVSRGPFIAAAKAGSLNRRMEAARGTDFRDTACLQGSPAASAWRLRQVTAIACMQ